MLKFPYDTTEDELLGARTVDEVVRYTVELDIVSELADAEIVKVLGDITGVEVDRMSELEDRCVDDETASELDEGAEDDASVEDGLAVASSELVKMAAEVLELREELLEDINELES